MNMTETKHLTKETCEQIERVYNKPYAQIRADQAQQHALALLDELKAMTTRYEDLRRAEGYHASAVTANAHRLIALCEPGV